MVKTHHKLAASLAVLRALQEGGRRVFASDELSRIHRERLLAGGFLQNPVKGWLVAAAPDVRPGDTTPFYVSFWEFCARYCESRFGAKWHLSSEQSLQLHAENSAVPRQVVVHSPHGQNNSVELAFGTTLFDLRQPAMPPARDLVVRNALRIFTPAAALVRVPESCFMREPVDVQVALGMIRDAEDLLGHLLEGGHSSVAGRLAGAFRRTGRPELADEIVGAMRAAGYVVAERDPLESAVVTHDDRAAAPLVIRLRTLWSSMRDVVLHEMPAPPGIPRSSAPYLKQLDDEYENDAYHSLSIEGYTVTPALIERVQAGSWNPDADDGDKRSRDALSARGYWQAFRQVREAVRQVLRDENAGSVAREAHRNWYRELFQPHVAAGLLPASTLAGYRRDAVYLKSSRYTPPRWEAVRDGMPALFDLLQEEPAPAVRAVLGHWLFGYIHPYMDGNGRLARLLMNVMLASGGYPWTVIRVEDRAAYLDALDRASVDGDIVPFARFIAARVSGGLAATGGSRAGSPTGRRPRPPRTRGGPTPGARRRTPRKGPPVRNAQPGPALGADQGLAVRSRPART